MIQFIKVLPSDISSFFICSTKDGKPQTCQDLPETYKKMKCWNFYFKNFVSIN